MPLLSPRYRRSLQPDAIIDRLKRKGFSPSLIACIPLTAIIIALWAGAAAAQDAEVTPEYVQGVLNTIWVLVATILVVFMNAGFGMLEAGLCRHKNAVNILAKNLIVFALASMAFWAIGFSIAFGGDNPFIGGGGWFLSSTDPGTYGLDPFPGGLPIPVFFFFQSAFVATAATIVSGAVAERIEFSAFLIFSLLLTGISYPITTHWVWSGNGWLGGMGFSDFAGSTVVHSMGGWAAMMGAAILGPRIGKYDANGQVRAIPGHNLGFATLGCLILWICWFGFNPGSQLAADEAVPYIALTTNLSACAGGITATMTSWLRDGKPDLSMVINGILAGLVGITAGCNVVSYWGAVIIGAVAGVLVVYSVSFFDKIRIDDPVGAVSVHLVNGAWGTLAVGIFADPNIPIGGEDALQGLFTGNPMQVVIQLVGILSIGGFTVLMSSIFWFALKATLGIRVDPEHEFEGLDIAEHGMEAYSGFLKEAPSAFSASATPGNPGRKADLH
ncbi:MAG: ammonium transporter [Cyanobacteriota bacterium]|nr:ammonium transporter [Cyanobacteriota bacterium]